MMMEEASRLAHVVFQCGEFLEMGKRDRRLLYYGRSYSVA
jgi:hypothetical protein